jgi:alkylation response protein AidB-like acyl-CoA dehydrogenase
MTTTSFGALLRTLAESKVDFIVIGGVAAGAHGSARATYDLAVVYARTKANMSRLWPRSPLSSHT